MTIKLSALTVSIVTALTVVAGTQANAATNSGYGAYGEETAYSLARDYAGRYTGAEMEEKAANYMQDRMTIAGSDNKVETRAFKFTPKRGIFKDQELTSNNVVVTQKGTTDKTLYVGAHYDSAVAYAGYDKLQALDDNASGSGVLTELTKNLSGIELEHNVEFVGFGAEEGGLNGSKAFAGALSDAEKTNALGMVNLDSLITGDFMYAHSGRNSYDKDGNAVPENTTLRDNAHRIAKELGIDLKMNPGLIPEGQDKPYRPAGVGCCSDQDSFDGIMQVVGFEATNWEIGEDLDGYTQTENPKIEDGYTWHDPTKDNEDYLVEAFGKEHISQRMTDYSRIVTRLIVEQTNADIVQSNKNAITLQNTMSAQLNESATGSHTAIRERANAIALNAPEPSEKGLNFWVDGSQSYMDTEGMDSGHRAQVGVYGEYEANPNWRVGLGLQAANQRNSDIVDGIKKNTNYGVQAYSLLGDKNSAWWNTTSLNYSKHDLDTTRNVKLDTNDGLNILNNTHNASTDADVFSAYNELGYNFLMNEKVKHGAFLGLNYNKVDIDGYTSGEADSRTALAIDGTSSDSFDAEVGYQLQYDFDYKGAPVKVQGKLAYVNVIEDGVIDGLTTTAVADGQKRDVKLGQVDNDDSYGRFGLSVSSNLHKNVHAYLNGDTTFARDNKDSAVQVGLQYQF